MSNSKAAGRPVDPNSALSRASAVYDRLMAANANTTSKEITTAFESELSVKAGTAQVYLFKVREARGLTTKRPRKAKTEAVADAPADTVVESDAPASETVAENEGLAEAA